MPHPHQNQWEMILEPLLNVAGVSTWNTFANGAVCVHVEAEGEILTIIPNVNHGARGGFTPDEASRRSIAMAVSPEAIGAMFRAAIACAH
jgi:hypothetical protein